MHPIITEISECMGNIKVYLRNLVEGYGYELNEIKIDDICVFPSNKEELINALKNTKIKTQIVRIARCFFVLEDAINCAAKIINGNEDYYEALKISNSFKDEKLFGRIAMIRFRGSNSLGKILLSGRHINLDCEELRNVVALIEVTLFILMSLMEVSGIDVKSFIDNLLNVYNLTGITQPKVTEDNYYYNDLKEIVGEKINSKEFFAILGQAVLAITHISSFFSDE